MKTLVVALVCLAVGVFGAPGGTYLSGPAGIVTDHGAIGPGGHGGGFGVGLGGYGGGFGGGGYSGGGHGQAIVGPVQPASALVGPQTGHAAVVGPVNGGASIIGPVHHGASVIGPAHGGGFGGLGGFGLGLGGGYGGAGLGFGGGVGLGHGGVTIKGPATVPATIAGPSGKIVADGLYGIPTHGHGW